MSKKFWKTHVDDVVNNGCTAAEVDMLLDAFCYAMKETACTLARKAEFCLEDFYSAKKNGIGHFTLTLAKAPNTSTEQWTGVFEAEGKSLNVLGMLERD